MLFCLFHFCTSHNILILFCSVWQILQLGLPTMTRGQEECIFTTAPLMESSANPHRSALRFGNAAYLARWESLGCESHSPLPRWSVWVCGSLAEILSFAALKTIIWLCTAYGVSLFDHFAQGTSVPCYYSTVAFYWALLPFHLVEYSTVQLLEVVTHCGNLFLLGPGRETTQYYDIWLFPGW